MGEASSHGLRLGLLAVVLAVVALTISLTGLYLTASQKTATETSTATSTVTVTETQTVVSTDRGNAITLTVNMSTITDTSRTQVEPPEKGALPIVRSPDKKYQGTEVVPAFFGIAEDSILKDQTVEWALSKRQEFIDVAVTKADNLGLDGENLLQILTKLLFRVDELNFTDKNVIGFKDGEKIVMPFLISNSTAQLPCLIEKATYNDMDAWIIALNWEYVPRGMTFHVAVVVLKYGTHEVLFAASCA